MSIAISCTEFCILQCCHVGTLKQPYDFKVVYKSGSSNPADFLSRHPVFSKKEQVNIADEYINSIMSDRTQKDWVGPKLLVVLKR